MPTPERYTLVKRVYLEAERLPKGERSRFIHTQCQDDAELEVEVRRLLTAIEGQPDFLETPALARAADNIGPGAQLGRFRIIKQLGEGGMGIVYEAEEDEPRRRIALKIIRSGGLTERLRSRFRHEIRILGQLRHPGIAQIYEAGTFKLGADLLPYFSMELISGPPLLRFAEDRAITLQERLILIAQICDAAHHAHQKAVIHRDLKPGNILVEDSPTTDSSSTTTIAPFQVKILDFGIARATDTQTVTLQTEPGQLIGTIPYMSPEQVSGQSDSIDIRSDVYSIGVIAFELLAGRLPYAIRERLLPEAVRMIHEAEPTRLGSINRSFRGDIETIISKALEKDKLLRYQSAADLAADIRRYLRDEPIVARPASALYQFRKFARRNQPLVIAACLVIVALIAATVVSTWQARVAFHAKTLAEGEKTRADQSAEVARRQALRATLSAVAAAVEGSDFIHARRLLNDTPQASRGWEWKYWDSRLDQSIAVFNAPAPIVGAWIDPQAGEVAMLLRDGRLLRGSPWSPQASTTLTGQPFLAAAFTADGSQLAATSGPGFKSLDMYSAVDGAILRHIADLPYRGSLVEVSADGATVCVGVKRQPGVPAADDVWLYDAEGAHQIRVKSRTSGIALSADARFVLMGYSNAVLRDLEAAANSPQTGELRGGLRFAISDDAALLATGGEDKTIRIWQRDSKDAVTLRGHAGNIAALAFSHDGTKFASASEDLTIRVWDTRSGHLQGSLAGHTRAARSLKFSADDSRLLSFSDDHTLRVWTLNPDDGVTILRGHSSYVYGVTFTPDGAQIASAGWDHSLRTWNSATGENLLAIKGKDAFLTGIAISPDGTTIATARTAPGAITLWNSSTGEEIARKAVGSRGVEEIVFSRDGSRLWAACDHDGAIAVTIPSLSSRPLTKGTPAKALALSPDQSELALGLVSGAIHICNADTGRTSRVLNGHRNWVSSVSFHPTKRLLASASSDRTARLWDLTTGTCRAVLDRHWDSVFATAFSPDGRILATGSDDTTIIIWDVESAEELTRLRGHDAYIYSLAFSPDGATLVSASGDHTIRVWDTRPIHTRWHARNAKTANTRPDLHSSPNGRAF